jgi:predicted transcriptional regulator
MRTAGEQNVSRENRREQLRQDAVVAWDDYRATGLHITYEEADAWLDLLQAGRTVEAPEPLLIRLPA